MERMEAIAVMLDTFKGFDVSISRSGESIWFEVSDEDMRIAVRRDRYDELDNAISELWGMIW